MSYADDIGVKKGEPVIAKLMTPNQLGFARDYVSGMPLARCYERNYSVSEKMDNDVAKRKAAGRVMRVSQVRGYIDKAREVAAMKTAIDSSWVLKESERLYRKCIADDDNVVARSTLELIGKNVLVGAFKDKSDINIDKMTQVNFNIQFDDPDSYNRPIGAGTNPDLDIQGAIDGHGESIDE